MSMSVTSGISRPAENAQGVDLYDSLAFAWARQPPDR
jgi:hypothetical protein